MKVNFCEVHRQYQLFLVVRTRKYLFERTFCSLVPLLFNVSLIIIIYIF